MSKIFKYVLVVVAVVVAVVAIFFPDDDDSDDRNDDPVVKVTKEPKGKQVNLDHVEEATIVNG